MASPPDGGNPEQYLQISHAVIGVGGVALAWLFGWFKSVILEIWVIKNGGKTRETEADRPAVTKNDLENHRAEIDRRVDDLARSHSNLSERLYTVMINLVSAGVVDATKKYR